MATASDSGIVTLWNVASGLHVSDVRFTTATDWPLAIAPHGEWIARSLSRYTVDLWERGGKLHRLSGGINCCQLLFSPRGDTLSVYGSEVDTPRLFDLSSKKLRTVHGPAHRKFITAQAFSLDGAILATAGGERAIILWDVATLDRLVQFYGHTAEVGSLAFSPDAQTLAAGTQDGLVRLWDLASGLELATFEGHSGPVKHACFSGDGLTLATCADLPVGKSEVFLWRARPPK